MITILGAQPRLAWDNWIAHRMILGKPKIQSGFGKCSAKLPANDVFGKYRQTLPAAAR